MKNVFKSISEKWYYIFADLFNKASIYLLTLVFSYLVAPDDFGSLSLYNSLFTLFFVFVSLNLTNNYITKKKLDNSSNFSEILSSIITFLGIINIFFIVFAVIVLIFKINIYSVSYLLIFCGLFSAILNCNYELLQTLFVTEKQKTRYLIVGLSFSIILMIFSFILYFICPKISIYSIIIVKIALLFVFSICSLIYMKNKYNIHFKIDKKILKEAMIFSTPLILHSLSGFVLNYVDKFMLNDIENLTTVAIYSFSYNISSVMMVVSLALNKALLPKFFEYKHNSENDKINALINKDLKLMFFLYIVYISCVGLIYRFFPSSYNNAFLIFLLLAYNYLIFYGYNVYSDYLYYHGKTTVILTNTLISGIINLILNYILIPEYSSIGATISTIISFVALFLLYYFSVKKIEEKFYPMGNFVKYFFLAGMFSLFYYVLYIYLWFKISCVIIIVIVALFLGRKVIKGNLR